MSDDERLSDLLEEYDGLTRSVASAGYQLFDASLRQWFAFLDSNAPFARTMLQLETSFNYTGWYERVVTPAGGRSRSGRPFPWPEDVREFLAARLGLCRAAVQGRLVPAEFTMVWLVGGRQKMDELIATFATQIFDPMASDLRRYLIRQSRSPQAATAHTQDIPAAGRTVTLDHNSASYVAAIDALDAASETLAQRNDFPNEAEKGQRLAELSAGRRLLEAAQLRLEAIRYTAVAALIALLSLYKDHLIGRVFEAALEALSVALGVDLGV